MFGNQRLLFFANSPLLYVWEAAAAFLATFSSPRCVYDAFMLQVFDQMMIDIF
jgi:hypothetical protein